MKPQSIFKDPTTLAIQPGNGLNMVHYDDAATYDYYCFAVPGTALTAADWYVVRIAKASSNVCHALPFGPTSVATDLGTVAALTYA